MNSIISPPDNGAKKVANRAGAEVREVNLSLIQSKHCKS